MVIYINPPYKEHSDAKQLKSTGKNISGVAKDTEAYKRFQGLIGTAARELFAQFLFRIKQDIPGAVIANFSTLKNLQASNFIRFRKQFDIKLKRIFVVPASTFDNVKGHFPIGFMIWDSNQQENFYHITADVFNAQGEKIGHKDIHSYVGDKYIIEWLRKFYDKKNNSTLGFLRMNGTDIQHNTQIFITRSYKKSVFYWE